MSTLSRRRRLEAGAGAPGFSIPSVEGPLRDLKSLGSGKPVLLAFFKVSCPTCQYTLPFLERLHQRQSSLSIFTISQDDAEDTRDFHRHFGLTMPALIDPAGDRYPASNAYGLTHVPSMFLVEPDGKISWAADGFSKAELEGLAARLGVPIFEPGEEVPAWRAG